MTKLNYRPPPPPLVLPVDVACALADVAWAVPCEVLYAVREVINDAISRMEADLRDRPRRRGNGAKRAQVDQDWGRWATIRGELTARSCCGPYTHHDGCAVGAVPDLGPAQWGIVAAYARRWKSSAEQLFMVAQGVMPDDEPVDWNAWRAWSRRQRWTFTASAAVERGRCKSVEADYADEDAQRLLRQAADSQHRGIEARREARRLEEEAEPHRLALELDDAGLAAYEAAIDAGVAPAAALQTARDSST
jgi:hypothetical protein